MIITDFDERFTLVEINTEAHILTITSHSPGDRTPGECLHEAVWWANQWNNENMLIMKVDVYFPIGNGTSGVQLGLFLAVGTTWNVQVIANYIDNLHKPGFVTN